MWHRNFGVFLKHACHQAVASDIINALKHKAEKKHETLSQVGKFTSIFVPFTSYLADITCPGSFLLAGRSQENNGEGLTVRRLNHNFKLQLVKSLTCCIVGNNTQQNKTLVAPQLSYYAWEKGNNDWRKTLTVFISGIQFLNQSTLDQGQHSSLLLLEEQTQLKLVMSLFI